jgi:type I restriction enzyme S subunit
MSESNELPKGWATAPLGVCGTWYGGGTPSKFNDAYWSGGTIPWISPKDMKRLRISDSEDHISTLALQETNVKAFPQGTVLIVIRSGILSRTLPVAVAEVEATMNQDLKGLLPSEGIESTYVAYFLQAEERDILRQCSKHGTTVASIDTTALHSYMLRFAPLQEQHRIVAKIEELFSDLDAGVAALKRAKANLKRYRASVLKSAVEGKLTEQWRAKHPAKEPASALLARILLERRQKWEADQLAKFAAAKKEPPKNWRDKYVEPTPPDTIDLPGLPEGWCWASVEQLIVRSEYGTSVKCDYDGVGPSVLRIPNIAAGEIDLADIKFAVQPLYLANDDGLQPGDMLMCRTNGSISLIGKAAVVRMELSPPHSFASYLLRFRFGSLASLPSWVHTCVSSFPGRRFIESNAASSAGQHNISLSLIHTMPIPLPPVVEQQQIMEAVSERLSQIDAAEKQIEHGLLRAARLRQSILKRAFEGKLVPQDPKDEPASALLERLRASRTHDEANGTTATSKPNRAKIKESSGEPRTRIRRRASTRNQQEE